jgi:phage-related protein
VGSSAPFYGRLTKGRAVIVYRQRNTGAPGNGAVLLLDFLYHFKYICSMLGNEKPIEWIGSSHKDLMGLPADVRRFFGFALSLAQAGDKHDSAKVLKGFGGAGVIEVVEDDAGGTYRAVYTVKFAEAVFVLHCFQKKSKRGIATPKEDMDIINARLKIAEAYVKGLRK